MHAASATELRTTGVTTCSACAIAVTASRKGEFGDGCQSICVIRIHTDEGIVGIGEVHTNPLAAKAIIDSPMYSVSGKASRM